MGSQEVTLPPTCTQGFPSCSLLPSVSAPVPRRPHPQPPPVPTEGQRLTAEVKDLSAQAQALLETQNRLVWDLWTEGKPVNIAATYPGKEGLFSVENIRKIDRLRQLTQDPREVRALTALKSHFAGEYLARELAEYNDAIANLEASLTFPVEGREVRYRDLERLLANEKSAVKRKALYAAAVPAIERLSQSLRRREERTEALVKELGYASYEAFGAELRQADLSRLSVLAEEILKATQEPYRTVMERLCAARAGPCPSRASPARTFRGCSARERWRTPSPRRERCSERTRR